MEKAMADESDNIASDLQGAGRLATDAVVGVTDVVESMHRTVTTFGGLLGGPERERTTGITGFVYGNVRTITRLVGVGLDAALTPLVGALGEMESSRGREAIVAALNGVLGDYLEQTGNPLAISMNVRRDGTPIAPDDAGFGDAVARAEGHVLLMVHGSSSNDLQWERKGHNHGVALAEEYGYAPIYLHYNSGLHISENGRALSDLLEAFVGDAAEVESLSILGHSMGGLVARSAYYYADEAGHQWQSKLARLACLGTPHHGAPLEKSGNWFENILQVSAYTAPFARLGKIRSAGVTDLRYGSILDDDWAGVERFALGSDNRTPVPLPEDVACYAVGATTGEEGGSIADHVVGDGLVPLTSALGEHDDPDRRLSFDDTLVVRGVDHLDLLCSTDVYDALSRWFSDRS
jgi:pimeloyl-ACP methyl ester carboxylesterase